MKRILFIVLSVLCLLFANTENGHAQQRKKIADGYYLVDYGKIQTIEDDVRGMCIEVKVEKAGRNSFGEQLYNVLCENQLVKGVAIGGLSEAISKALTAAGIPIPKWVIGPAVGYIYEAICDYYGE